MLKLVKTTKNRLAKNPRVRMLAATAFLMVASVGSAYAADGDAYDPTADVAKIAAAVVVAVTISVAFTSGYIGIKSSKLPRRGA
ncbi:MULTISPECIES: hypothetical protein [Luteibacter]|uniref:hypothetical protein n=1 Tax=Luteibacter TaxID=242605 RepID=UPI00056B7F0B|nr:MULTISPECIES: hypothetical protein [unclassified Luteibacter]